MQRSYWRGNNGDQEEPKKNSRKLGKEQPSLSVLYHSLSLFKMGINVDINPYQGEIDALKSNH